MDIGLYLESRPGTCCAFRLYINYFGSINPFLSCEDKKIIKSTKSQARNMFQNIGPSIKNQIPSTEGRLKGFNPALSVWDHPWRSGAGGEAHPTSQSIRGLWSVMAVKVISNDSEFTKHIKANKFVLAIFVDDNSVLEVTDQQRWINSSVIF